MMHVINNLKKYLYLGLFIVVTPLISDEIQNNLMYFCNPEISSFIIDLGEQNSSYKKKSYIRNSINWEKLIVLGRAMNERGDLLRHGSKTVIKKCGNITIEFKGGYLNENIQGESGAVEFPVLQLKVGQTTIIPFTPLEICSIEDKRAKTYYGECPEKWAKSVETISFNSLIQTTVKRNFYDENFHEHQSVSVISTKTPKK